LRKKRVITYIIFIILTLSFIFGNSLLPGSKSSAESNVFSNIFIKIFYPDFSSLDGTKQEVITNFSTLIVRKSAHITEYLTLGIFVFLLLKEFISSNLIYILMPCFIYMVAIVDESIQIFTPNRGPSIKDTFIDLSGALLFSIITFLIKNRRRKVPYENNRKTK